MFLMFVSLVGGAPTVKKSKKRTREETPGTSFSLGLIQTSEIDFCASITSNAFSWFSFSLFLEAEDFDDKKVSKKDNKLGRSSFSSSSFHVFTFCNFTFFRILIPSNIYFAFYCCGPTRFCCPSLLWSSSSAALALLLMSTVSCSSIRSSSTSIAASKASLLEGHSSEVSTSFSFSSFSPFSFFYAGRFLDPVTLSLLGTFGGFYVSLGESSRVSLTFLEILLFGNVQSPIVCDLFFVVALLL